MTRIGRLDVSFVSCLSLSLVALSGGGHSVVVQVNVRLCPCVDAKEKRKKKKNDNAKRLQNQPRLWSRGGDCVSSLCVRLDRAHFIQNAAKREKS